MAKETHSATDFPEFGVRYETFRKFFDPALPRSTFHDLVNKGKIIPMKGLRGFYLMNESRRRLGLCELSKAPGNDEQSMEDLIRFAFNLIDFSLFPEPAWLGWVESISSKDRDHIMALADRYRDNVNAYQTKEEKLGYFQGVLDADFADRKVGN